MFSDLGCDLPVVCPEERVRVLTDCSAMAGRSRMFETCFAGVLCGGFRHVACVLMIYGLRAPTPIARSVRTYTAVI